VLASGKEHLGDAGCGQDADVPRASVRHIGEQLEAEAGKAGLDRGIAADELGARRGEAEGGGSADVLAGQVDRTDVQRVDESFEIGCCDRTRVLGACRSGVAEAAEVDGEHSVLLGERRDELVERPPALGKPVNEQYGRAGVSCGDVVQLRSVQMHAVMDDAVDGGARRIDDRVFLDGLHGSSVSILTTRLSNYYLDNLVVKLVQPH
jgi:hypothetical protein